MTWTWKLMLTKRFWLPTVYWSKKQGWNDKEEVYWYEELTMLSPVWTHCIRVRYGTRIRKYTTGQVNKVLNRIKR
jgi:hypothetical protein